MKTMDMLKGWARRVWDHWEADRDHKAGKMVVALANGDHCAAPEIGAVMNALDHVDRLEQLEVDIPALVKANGWGEYWRDRCAYATLEQAEYFEALRGKGGDKLSEAADWLICYLSSIALGELTLEQVVRRAAEIVEEQTDPGYFVANIDKGYSGNSPMWLAEEGGYTDKLDEARVFKRDEMQTELRRCKSTHLRAYPVKETRRAVKPVVDTQYLPENVITVELKDLQG